MKRTHIAIIILIAAAMGAIIVTLGDASTYVSFETADKNVSEDFTVIGYLDKEAEMNYDARRNLFTFYALDKEGNRKKVVYAQPKPQDFERSEEITMQGHSADSVFVANQILMKCPSKYNEQNELVDPNQIYTE